MLCGNNSTSYSLYTVRKYRHTHIIHKAETAVVLQVQPDNQNTYNVSLRCGRGKAVSITHPDCYNLTQLITRFAFLNLRESKCSKQRNTNFVNNSILYYFYYFTIIRVYICLVVCMRLSKVYPMVASVSRTPLISSWVRNRIHQLYFVQSIGIKSG